MIAPLNGTRVPYVCFVEEEEIKNIAVILNGRATIAVTGEADKRSLR